PPQARLVGRPVPYLERHLRDVVTAIGVVFVRHREQLEPEREEHPTIPGPAECTNASRRSIAAANGMINRLPQLAAATTSAVRRFRGSPREASPVKFTG